ncbi:hypothetical protein CAP51_07470 [Acinetobacter populi]|uniref:Uncharacterized protein n=1 Tax=Acinetobacter populi TaxID=1582270 RepID=A0A1Z9YZD8_9GAMM|nr:hypothetical protein CAP51_07470 [Acinetobacter populi]
MKCFTIENLYLGKMHTLLFRQWKNRIKGRDWIKSDLSQQDFLTLLRKKKIDSVDFEHAKQDRMCDHLFKI